MYNTTLYLFPTRIDVHVLIKMLSSSFECKPMCCIPIVSVRLKCRCTHTTTNIITKMRTTLDPADMSPTSDTLVVGSGGSDAGKKTMKTAKMLLAYQTVFFYLNKCV